ncbi:hypothetical protein EDB89DRAFT_2006707 [Lactarius sanguifluus]|nr:hypothetical protein EDB89DRAFT_2006707 [Lactarius sanguifluus]
MQFVFFFFSHGLYFVCAASSPTRYGMTPYLYILTARGAIILFDLHCAGSMLDASMSYIVLVPVERTLNPTCSIVLEIRSPGTDIALASLMGILSRSRHFPCSTINYDSKLIRYSSTTGIVNFKGYHSGCRAVTV